MSQSTYSYANHIAQDYHLIQADVEHILDQMEGDNYSREGFYKDDHLFYSIIYRDGIPYEASTVITRPIFYGGARVLNRLMVVPDMRDKVPSAKIPETTLTMLSAQVKFALQDHEFAFISREFNTYLFMRRFAQDASKYMRTDWMYDMERQLVHDDHKSETSLQYVAWTGVDELPFFTEHDVQ